MKEKWTEKDIGNIRDKIIIVTGGNSGLGYESVKIFAGKGARVILASRSLERGQEAKESILETYPNSSIEVMVLDLASFESIKLFADNFKSRYDQLDILLNNAGIMMTPYGWTEDGLEQQIGVNHFGHFALTARLFDLLKATPSSRVVNISSLAHRSGEMDFDNLLFKKSKGYTPGKAYGRSKLANLLFTYELQRKVEKSGLDMKVLAAHPGVSATNLARYMMVGWLYKLVFPLYKLLTQSPYQGCLPGIRASVDPKVKGGSYYGPNKRGEVAGNPVLVESNKASHNLDDANRLWEVSEKITGLKFEF